MGDRRDAYGVLVGSREGRNLLEDPGVDRITLKWILEKWDGGHKLDGSSSGKGQVARCCKCGNELSSSVKCGKFLSS
jgi:hypothetical protein